MALCTPQSSSNLIAAAMASFEVTKRCVQKESVQLALVLFCRRICPVDAHLDEATQESLFTAANPMSLRVSFEVAFPKFPHRFT